MTLNLSVIEFAKYDPESNNTIVNTRGDFGTPVYLSIEGTLEDIKKQVDGRWNQIHIISNEFKKLVV